VTLCKTCSDTKRHLIYSDGRGRTLTEKEYKDFFRGSASILESMCKENFSSDWLKFMSSMNMDKKDSKYNTYFQEFRKEQIQMIDWVPKMVPCESCVKDEMEAYYEKSRGEAVTGAVFSRLSKEGKIHPDIVEMAKEENMQSFLVIGPTGKGKTPLLMLNYNRIVKRNKSTDGVRFTTESKIRDILDHDENFENWLKQLNSVDFLFIDEMFRNEVWKDLGDGTERDKSNRAARNMWTFIDYLYKRGDTIVVQGAGNKSPDETLPGLKNDSAAEYWRRINETFKDIRRIG
jgi:predicted ATPase